MAFGNLTLKTDLSSPAGVATLWAEATAVPVNGNNTIGLPFVAAGILPAVVDEDWLVITLELGASILSASWVSLAADKGSMVIDFNQTGADSARVVVQIPHQATR